jgi:hypothetical protein
MVPNLISRPRMLGKGASVLKIQVFLLQVKLSSALYCLEQLVVWEFRRVPPSILLILMKVIDLMDESV